MINFKTNLGENKETMLYILDLSILTWLFL